MNTNTVSPKREISDSFILSFAFSFLSTPHSLALSPRSFDPHPTHVAALAGLFFRARAVRFCIRWLSTPSVLMGFRQCHLTQAHSGFWDCLSWLSWRSVGHYSSTFTHLLGAFIQSFCAVNLPVWWNPSVSLGGLRPSLVSLYLLPKYIWPYVWVCWESNDAAGAIKDWETDSSPPSLSFAPIKER